MISSLVGGDTLVSRSLIHATGFWRSPSFAVGQVEYFRSHIFYSCWHVPSGYDAYDRLSPPLRTFLEGLTALHNADFFVEVHSDCCHLEISYQVCSVRKTKRTSNAGSARVPWEYWIRFDCGTVSLDFFVFYLSPNAGPVLLFGLIRWQASSLYSLTKRG